MRTTFKRILLVLIMMVFVSACKIENTIEGSGGFYADDNQSLSK